MLDHGADIRALQEILGHSELKTTQIYTRVSIARLKAVHTATHPGKMPLIVSIIDALTKNANAGRTYFSLWCRNFDQQIVEVPKVKRAKAAIAELRSMVESHQDEEKEREEIKRRQKDDV